MTRRGDRSRAPKPSAKPGETLGARIRQARLAAGLTQQQLAGRELTKAMISHLEVGRARPSQRSLEIIATRLGKDVGYFLGRDAASREVQLELHERAGDAAAEIRDWTGVRRHARAALRLSDGKRSALALRSLARADNAAGRYVRALAATRKALGLLDASGSDAREVALVLLTQADTYLGMAQPSTAAQELERALALLERHKVPDSALRSRLHNLLGMTYRRLGDPRQAIVEFERAVETANKVDELRLAGRAYLGIAASQHDMHDLSTAIQSYQRAGELLQRASDAVFEVVAMRLIAEAQLEAGEVAEARRSAERAAVRAIEAGAKDELAVAKIILADIAIREGRPEEGMRLAQEVEQELATRPKVSNVLQRGDAIRVIGDAFHAQRRWADSDREYARALAMVEKPSRDSWDRMVGFYAQRLHERGKSREAYEWLMRTRRRT